MLRSPWPCPNAGLWITRGNPPTTRYRVGMRWDDLFADLESQLEQKLSADEVDFRAEEERLRLARLGLRDRLASVHRAASAGVEAAVRLVLRTGGVVVVTPSSFGRDWLAGEVTDGTRHPPFGIIPMDAIGSVVLTRDQVYASLDAVEPAETSHALSARLGLGFVLRDLCRRRQPLELHLVGGVIHGTLDRVGRDHCDIAVHEAGSVRREADVREFRMVRFSELLVVSVRPG
jgi:hypothetical protein